MATTYRDPNAPRSDRGRKDSTNQRFRPRLHPGDPLPSDQRVSVGVLVDLERTSQAGGHIRCWEHFAEGALAFPDALDLTVYFLGQRTETTRLGSNVRLCTLKAQFGTADLSWLQQGAGNTDLTPFHVGLARQVGHHHVLHATAVFAFARTAKIMSRYCGLPLIASLHTDFPKFTEVYAREIITQLLGAGRIGRWMSERSGIVNAYARSMQRSIRALANRSSHVLYSREQDHAWLVDLKGKEHVTRLRRGIDKDLYHPDRCDRSWLKQRFNIDEDRFVLLFVGRADASKNVMTAALAARRLLHLGRPVHFFLAGDGADREAVRSTLGSDATLPGYLAPDMLAAVYASADVFVFPSRSEIMPNVVLEAKASGLPPVVDAGEASAQLVALPGVDGLLVGEETPLAWAMAIDQLIQSPSRHLAMREAARTWIEDVAPSWQQVVSEDLLPVWQAAARSVAQRQGRVAGGFGGPPTPAR